MCVCVCLCAICMPDTCRCQKGALDPLALELQRVMARRGVVGKQEQVLLTSQPSLQPLIFYYICLFLN